MNRILIVDDDESVRTSLRRALVRQDRVILEAGSGEKALEILAHHPADLVLTDIRMSAISGLDLLGAVKERWPGTVVILLTGHASLESAIQALRQGAHDYLLKPASIHEVRASVREGLVKRQELLRRQDLVVKLQKGIMELSQSQNADDAYTPATRAPQGEGEEMDEDAPPRWLRIGQVTVDRLGHTVDVAGVTVTLTATESRLLVCLLSNRGRVLRYQELAEKVLGYACDLYEARQLIMPHVSNLRRKLRVRSDSPDLIKNVRGVGYTVPQENLTQS